MYLVPGLQQIFFYSIHNITEVTFDNYACRKPVAEYDRGRICESVANPSYHGVAVITAGSYHAVSRPQSYHNFYHAEDVIYAFYATLGQGIFLKGFVVPFLQFKTSFGL